MRTLLLAVLALGFATTTSAANRPDIDVLRDVSTQVNRYPYFTIFDSVSANIDNGVVTLSGKVTAPLKVSDIEKRIAKIDGVTGVVNAIGVLPVSPFDARLRLGIARAIYSNPVLSVYGLSANPSIHVIVENGRVTLDGVVDTEMDKTIAASVARLSVAFDVTNNLKTTDEMRKLLEKV